VDMAEEDCKGSFGGIEFSPRRVTKVFG